MMARHGQPVTKAESGATRGTSARRTRLLVGQPHGDGVEVRGWPVSGADQDAAVGARVHAYSVGEEGAGALDAEGECRQSGMFPLVRFDGLFVVGEDRGRICFADDQRLHARAERQEGRRVQ